MLPTLWQQLRVGPRMGVLFRCPHTFGYFMNIMYENDLQESLAQVSSNLQRYQAQCLNSRVMFFHSITFLMSACYLPPIGPKWKECSMMVNLGLTKSPFTSLSVGVKIKEEYSSPRTKRN